MPKNRPYACPKCDRRFSMPAHLARHMNTTHGGRSRAIVIKSRRAGAIVPRGGIRKVLAAAGDMLSDQMHGVVDALRAARDRVIQQRSRLDAQFAAIGRALAALGGASESRNARSRMDRSAGGRGRRRARRGAVIRSILRAVNDSGPLKPAEVARLSGVKPTTVSTALDTLRKKSLAVRTGAGWSLTAAGRADLEKRERVAS